MKTTWDAYAVHEDMNELVGRLVIEDGRISIVSLVDEDDRDYFMEIVEELDSAEEAALVRKMREHHALKLVPATGN